MDASKLAVITGASSGIGKATAVALAARGWSIIGHGRDPQRCAQAAVEIRGSAQTDAAIHILRGDLALLSDVRRLAGEIRDRAKHIDVLINNAGGVRDRMIITPEGNEATFAGNHLGHFLLTNALLPVLRQTAYARGAGSVRVLSVSSSGHEYCLGIDWNDLQQIKDWRSGKNYCLAKLCNLLFTRELARRAGKDGIIAHAMHPGEVASNFSSHATPEMRALTANSSRVDPSAPARTLAWLAADAEIGRVTGRYYFDETEITPSTAALDDDAAARLWVESERLIAKAGYVIDAQ